MWLLHTEEIILRDFTMNPSSSWTERSLLEPEHPARSGYAILSHVWSRDPKQPEDTFESVRGLAELSPAERLSKVAAKIRECCRYARKCGFAWVWIDTCCINKSSSAELSEAINSMYRWYAQADLCIAFLADVTDLQGLSKSEWFERGWTLQELIAPKHVVFVSKRWRQLGTKNTLARTIEMHIDADVLLHETPLREVNVARRMSWAAKRRTTRLEDEAYCLMGIFEVNMPIIYGEGHGAFRRLQEEILRSSADQTILLWDEYTSSQADNPIAIRPDRFSQSRIVESLPPNEYGKAFLAFEAFEKQARGNVGKSSIPQVRDKTSVTLNPMLTSD